MISLLIIYTYIVFLTFSLGVLVSIAFSKIKLIESDKEPIVSPDIYILIGLVILTLFLGFYNIFSAVNLTTNVILFILVFALILVNRNYFNEIFSQYWIWIKSNHRIAIIALASFSPILLLLILFSVNFIQSFDTGLYHAQYIQWIESFKTPPGLVWIHGRFAFNSHFHVLSALFTFSSLGFKNSSLAPIVFYPLNSFIFLLFTLRCIYKVTSGIIIDDLFKATLYSVLLFTSFCIFGPKIQSPMADIAVAILIFYVFIIMIENFSFSRGLTLSVVTIFLLVFTLPTFKLTTGLIGLILIPILIHLKFKKITTLIGIGMIIILPFLIRNVIISGYLIYGIPQVDLFNVEWKIPSENVLVDNEVVKAWAKVPYKSYKEVEAMKFSEWFPLWQKEYNIDLNAYVLRISLISPILAILVFWVRRKIISKNMWIVASVLLVNIIFWFLTAPDPRFAWGFLYLNFAFTLALVISLFKGRVVQYSTALVLCYFMYKSILYTNSSWSQLTNDDFIVETRWYPKQIPSAPTSIFEEGTFELYVPANPDGRCFNEKLPCTPYPLRRVRMRGATLAEGFLYDPTIK